MRSRPPSAIATRPFTSQHYVSKANQLDESTAANYGQHLPPPLQHATLNRISSYHSRDLIDSHAMRLGISKSDLEKEMKSRPYSSRSSSAIGSIANQAKKMEKDLHFIKLEQSMEGDMEKRIQQTAKSKVSELDVLRSRTEFETVRRAEQTQIARRAQTAQTTHALNGSALVSRFKSPNHSGVSVSAWSLDSKQKDKSPWICSNHTPTGQASARPYSALRNLVNKRPITTFNPVDFNQSSIPLDHHAEEHIQVDKVRTAFAKSGLHIPLASIENALLTPVFKLSEEEKRSLFTTQASMLNPNPFLETEKKNSDKIVAKATSKEKSKKKK